MSTLARPDSFRAQFRLMLDIAKRDLRNRFAGSHLGLLWAFIVPLSSSVVFILVFGMLIKGTMGGVKYAKLDFTTLYFLGYAPWLLFADVLARSTTLLRENRALIRNLRFNHRLLPMSACASSIVAHAVVVGISLALVVGNGYPLSEHMYMLPVYFVLLLAFTLGVSYFVAAISVYLVDLVQVVPIALNLFFFMTPILYTAQLVIDSGSRLAVVALLKLNPMTQFVEGYRTAMVRVDEPIDTVAIARMAAWAAVTLALGFFTYRRLEKGFADVL